MSGVNKHTMHNKYATPHIFGIARKQILMRVHPKSWKGCPRRNKIDKKRNGKLASILYIGMLFI